MGLQTEDLVIKENGRHANENGFALILKGIYQGFGYLDKDIELENPDEYLFYVQSKKDNRDIQRILRSYLTKNETP